VYTLQNKMPVVAIQNKGGAFITPNIKSVSSAAEVTIPEDTRVSITDTQSKDGYPISGFTWLLVYKEQQYQNRTREQAKEIIHLIRWMLSEGQNVTEPLGYSPLSKAAAEKARGQLKLVTFGGISLI